MKLDFTVCNSMLIVILSIIKCVDKNESQLKDIPIIKLEELNESDFDLLSVINNFTYIPLESKSNNNNE